MVCLLWWRQCFQLVSWPAGHWKHLLAVYQVVQQGEHLLLLAGLLLAADCPGHRLKLWKDTFVPLVLQVMTRLRRQ